jgi:hypothetical protein
MKTAELTGKALDWAVAKCEGVDEYILETAFYSAWCSGRFNFSSDWAQGGKIIERERIGLRDAGGDGWAADDNIHATQYAETPLVAAMRCYVTSKLGDEVEVPVELI